MELTPALSRAVQCVATGNGGAINLPRLCVEKGTLVRLSEASSEVLASGIDGSRSLELAILRFVLATSRVGFEPDAAIRFNLQLLLRLVAMAMRSCVDESNLNFLLACIFGLSGACGRRLFVDEIFDFLCASLSSARAQARCWSLGLLLELYVRDSEIHRADLDARLYQECTQLPSVLICSPEASDAWVTEVALATAIIAALPNHFTPSTQNSDVQHEARFDSALLLLQSCPHHNMLAAAAIAPLLHRDNPASLEHSGTTVLQVSSVANWSARSLRHSIRHSLCVRCAGTARAEAGARAAAASQCSRAAHEATVRARARQPARRSRQIA